MKPKYRLTLNEEELIELEKELVILNSTNPLTLKILAKVRVQLVKIQGGIVKPAFVANSTSVNPTMLKQSTSLSIQELRHAAYTKLCEQGQEALNSAESELAFTYMYFNDLLTEEQKIDYEDRYLGI